MRFVSIKDVKNNIGKIRKQVESGQDLLLTYNGKPIAILLPISGEEDVFSLLESLKRYQLLRLTEKMQMDSFRKGAANVSMEEVNNEIKKVRRSLRRSRE